MGTMIDIDALASLCSSGCSKILFRGKPRLKSLFLIPFLVSYMLAIRAGGKALFRRLGRRKTPSNCAKLPETGSNGTSNGTTKSRCGLLRADITGAPAHHQLESGKIAYSVYCALRLRFVWASGTAVLITR